MKIPMNGNHRGSANGVLNEHREVEKKPRKTRDELERRVRVRTAELAEANEKLRADIARQKRVEEVLRQRQRRLDALLDTSSSLVFLKHPGGKVIYANPRFRGLLQSTSEEMLGAPYEELFPADRVSALAGDDGKRASSSTAGGVDTGTLARMAGSPGRNNDRVYTICGFVSEITARKEAQECLRELSSRDVRSASGESGKIARKLVHVTRPSLDVIIARLQVVKNQAQGLDNHVSAALEEGLALTEQVARDLHILSKFLHPSYREIKV